MCTFFIVLIKVRGSQLGVILPVGDIRLCLKTFLIVITGVRVGEVVTDRWWGEAREAADTL